MGFIVLLLLLFTSFLVYSGITLNFVPHIKKRNEILKYRKVSTFEIPKNTVIIVTIYL